MQISQVLYKDIPRDIYKKGFGFCFPLGSKEIYFKLEKDLIDSELWEIVDNNQNYPKGVVIIEALGQYNYFAVTYYPSEITEEKISDFVKKIDFGKK